jgi:hypothetical protein
MKVSMFLSELNQTFAILCFCCYEKFPQNQVIR